VISRRAFVGGLAILIALPRAGRAQPAKRHRIGYLLLTPLVNPPSVERAAFLAELRNLGYTDGKNLRIEYRSASGSRQLLAALAEDLVREKVDVIVATSTPAARAASQATHSIPIVMLGISDAQRAKLVTNFARPEANVTGVTWLTPELVAKRFQLIRDTLPRAARVALIWNPDDAAAMEQLPIARDAASRLRLELNDYHVADAEQLQQALDKLARERPDALFVIADGRMVTYRKIIADEALKLRVPFFSAYRGFTDAGGLMSYAADLAELYRRGATYVAKLLAGAKATELPVEQPSRFQLVLNLKTAKTLGLRIPYSVMVLADELIQ
jgi:putative ABC transport system substrate-binding protein